MSWSIEGRYFENCSCNFVCPCTVSLDVGADRDYCRALLVFEVDRGEADGVDLAGVKVAAVVDSPKVMADGNWRLGMIIDDGASDEQAEKIGGVFSGEMGGPMAGLGPLVTEQLGVERLPIEITDDGGKHAVNIGSGQVDIEVEEVVSFGREDGKVAQLNNIFHPAGEALNIARATRSKVDILGVDFTSEGGSGFAAPFAWSG